MCAPILVTKLDGLNGYAQVCSSQDVVGIILPIRGIWCEYNSKRQDTYTMMQEKKSMMILWQPQYQSNDYYKNLFKALIDEVEIYEVPSDEPVLVLRQLAKNVVVEGANRDFLWEADPAQIAEAKVTLSESMKVAIFLEGVNV